MKIIFLIYLIYSNLSFIFIIVNIFEKILYEINFDKDKKLSIEGEKICLIH